MKHLTAKTVTETLSSSVAVLCLSTALPALAAEETAGDDGWRDSKRSAQEFWQEFKQDSKQNWKDSKAAFRDGWIEGKLETAILTNEHLSLFDIDVEVDNYTAILTGEVSSEVESELAEEIALGIEGIDEVDNRLKINKDLKVDKDTEDDTHERSFVRYLKDSTLVADIKTDLIASDSIKSMDIDVDAYNANVTLNGKVGSETEKSLAEKIVKNNPSVRGVVNNLKVEK